MVNEKKASKENKKRLPWWAILLIVVGGILLFLGLFLLGVRGYFRLSVNDYYKHSKATFYIPGTNDGFIAQGIADDTVGNNFFVTGYMNDGSASPVYLVDKDSGKLKKTVFVQTEDGSDFKGHCGGIEVYGDYVYIAGGGDCCLYVCRYIDVIGAADGGKVKMIGKVDLKVSDSDKVRVSFVTKTNLGLIAGEFYRAGNYDTLESHWYKTAAGDQNKAMAVFLKFSEEGEFGVEAPSAALSLPDQVQGICSTGESLYLSTSYGPSFSYIYRYDWTEAKTNEKVNLLGQELPLYVFDSASQKSAKKIAPMSEEIIIVGGKLYTMCESASNKYIFGKFTSSDHCYATDLNFFD